MDKDLGALESAREANEDSPGRSKWWESKIALSILALVIPLTTLIKEGVITYKANLLAQDQQEHQVQMEYLTLVTRTDLGLRNQALVLRFLKATARQEETRTWATAELHVTEAAEKDITRELSMYKQQRSALEEEINKLKLLTTTKVTPDVSLRLKALKDNNNRKEIEIAKINRRLDSPANFPAPSIQGVHYRCIVGTVSPSEASNDNDHVAVCLNSLPADGLPLEGSFDAGGLSYSWTVNGTTCLCRVVSSSTG
jgi:hypothetical protein